MKPKLFVCCIMLIVMNACSKSSSKPSGNNTGGGTLTTAMLSGYWSGTFSAGNEGQIFNADGTTVQYDFYGTTITDSAQAPYKGYGTYTIKGDSIVFNLIYPTVGNETFTERAVVNTTASPNTIIGVYTGSGSGSFMLTKQ